jgi:hypothetical protein
MKKIKPQNKKDEISLEITTNFGKLSGSFNFDDVQERFKDEFDNYIEVSNDYKHYFFATELAEDLLKELLPRILEEALNQVWLEAKARTLHELNNKPCFLIYESTEDNNIETVEVFALPKKEIKKISDEIAEKAKKYSHQRMKTEELSKRGGNKPKKLSNYDFIHLDEFYRFYYLQARSILEFYKWQKELTKKNDCDYTQYFLEIMFQPARQVGDLLFEKLDDPEITEEEKIRYLNIRDSYGVVLRLKSNEIELWKDTFRKVLKDDSDRQEKITFGVLSPEKLTYHYLATIFQDKYNTEFSSGTIEKNIQEIRRIKRGDD